MLRLQYSFISILALETATCPRCNQPVNSQVVTCPYCRTQLKAYGHPGIPLHRANGSEYLCNSCTYHADDSCNFPQRPYAQECTLYENFQERELELQQQIQAKSFGVSFRKWVQQNQAWLWLLGLLLICLAIALSSS
ncbi:MAG: zinc ribbon domain-containing protein [Calothrix sp. MO_192.B10]|nr:zinc ribbon domain-containing protein [Calothrix sp. MO_192.B10]